MPFERPALDTLIERVKTDIKGGLNITTVLRRSFLGVISRAIAGMSHLMLGYLTWVARQVFPDTAELEYLDRWSSIWGVSRNESTFAQFEIDFTGNDGGVIPSGTELQRDDGFIYTTDSEGIIAAGTITVQVTASESGSNGDMDNGQAIALISPITNVDSEATISSIITDADDTESDDSLRERLINRLQLPPLGGSANDYIQWQREVTGVTRSWVLPLNGGPGTVGCSFVVDDEDPIIPSPAKVSEVQAYVDERKPVTALVTVFAPVDAPMDLDISIKPNTIDVQTAIITELEDLVKRDANLAGSYGGPAVVNDGSILLSKIRQSISIAIGIEDFEINTINGSAPGNVIPNTGELITLGSVSWQILP
jgi:uncharacterized phage protein gp47/JayE